MRLPYEGARYAAPRTGNTMLREEKLVTTIVAPAPNLLPHVASAAVAGGASWALYYAGWIVNGMITGQAPAIGAGTVYYVLGSLFCAALCAISIGLGLLALAMRPRHQVLGTVALVVALVSFAAPFYGLFTRVLAGETVGGFGGVGVLGSCLAATLLGAAALRSGQLPRRVAALLLALGLVSFPLIIVLGMVANLWFPAWVTDELPFAVAGIAWVVFGRLVRRAS
jgi:hypothetical protein